MSTKALVLIVGVAACDSAARTGDTLADSNRTTTIETDAVSRDWAVKPTGAGPVTIGMTLAELAQYLNTSDTAGVGGACDYVAVRGAPNGVRFMVESGRLVRIDVVGGKAATAEGASVGDAESRIVSLYPGLRRLPHKYTSGSFYLIALPNAPADTMHRYVFETDGLRVTRYRAGVFPPVEYVEGCG